MNEIKRLLSNIQSLIVCDCLECEMEVFAEENPNLDSICELNEMMEDEISRIHENSEEDAE